ncbi:MAG TPA: trehalose-6-phosphate synthase [bacterium]|nr:trehalose-6-phosphate synthase [bacterium]
MRTVLDLPRLIAPSRIPETRRLIVVSNREPYTLKKTGRTWVYQRTIGGLVSALDLVLRVTKGTWISWGGAEGYSFSGGGEDQLEAAGKPPYRLASVDRSEKQVEHFYEGYANGQLWPLFHSFLERCHFNREDWSYYKLVNQKFAAAAEKLARPGDLLWIHDYQLCLVPQLVRAKRHRQKIGFFCHIPFPPPEIFRALPQRKDILRGLLGSTVIGFQGERDRKNFLESVQALLPGEAQIRSDTIYVADHDCRVIACPIGIDFLFYKSLAESHAAEVKARELKKEINCRFIGLGVDRQDYSKGIHQRLLAVERFLEKHPAYRKHLVFLQIMVPSRAHLPEYQALKSDIELAVGRINGKFQDRTWSPILYYYHGFTPNELAAFYRLADFALVTPLKDGMNLVAKEYAACSVKNSGSLILSEFTGSAEQLKEAWLVNPHDIEGVADTIYRVLTEPKPEVEQRMAALRQGIRQQDIHWWVQTFLRELLA